MPKDYFKLKGLCLYLQNKLNIIEMSTEKKMHYNQQDLSEFRAIIMAKLEEAKENYGYLKTSYSGENHTNDTSPTFKLMEDAESLSKEDIGQLLDRERKYIENLEAALVRIENKTYGICRITGTLIPKERLKLVPHATLSIEAKNMQNKNK